MGSEINPRSRLIQSSNSPFYQLNAAAREIAYPIPLIPLNSSVLQLLLGIHQDASMTRLRSRGQVIQPHWMHPGVPWQERHFGRMRGALCQLPDEFQSLREPPIDCIG